MTLSIFSVLIFLLAVTSPLLSQTGYRQMSSGSYVTLKEETYFTKPLHIIDMPTASILRGGDFYTGVRIFQNGGLLGSLSAGISNKMMFGISYGGTNIIGEKQQIFWHKTPGIHLKYRAVDESLRLPAVTLGIETQGQGVYWSEKNLKEPYKIIDEEKTATANDSLGQYDFLPRGIYCVVSKVYSSVITSTLHTGVSYSLNKRANKKSSPTIFMAGNFNLARDIAILLEYDFALNDAGRYQQGILNMGIRWAFGNNIFFDFDIQNALGREDGKPNVRRIITFSYYGSIMR